MGFFNIQNRGFLYLGLPRTGTTPSTISRSGYPGWVGSVFFAFRSFSQSAGLVALFLLRIVALGSASVARGSAWLEAWLISSGIARVRLNPASSGLPIASKPSRFLWLGSSSSGIGRDRRAMKAAGL